MLKRLAHVSCIAFFLSLGLLVSTQFSFAEIILDDTGLNLTINTNTTVDSANPETGYAIGIRSSQSSATLINSASLSLTGASLNDIISGIYSTGNAATIRNTADGLIDFKHLGVGANTPLVHTGIYSTGESANILNNGQILVTEDSDRSGIGVYSTGLNATITNNGTIANNTDLFVTRGGAIYASGDNVSLTNANNANLTGWYAVKLYGATPTITNAGTIRGDSVGINMNGVNTTLTLTNEATGLIYGSTVNSKAIEIDRGLINLDNAGIIRAEVSAGGSYTDAINLSASNSGTHLITNRVGGIITAGATSGAAGSYNHAIVQYDWRPNLTITNEGTIASYGDGTAGDFGDCQCPLSGTIYHYGNNFLLDNKSTGVVSARGTYTMAVDNAATSGSITNRGQIFSIGDNSYGIYSNYSDGTTHSITNLSGGSITSSGANSAAIYNTGSVVMSDIINIGTISATGSNAFGINNTTKTLTNLVNLQGAGNTSGALTYTGKLPTNYYIHITDPSHYGQLNLSAVTGATNFDIYEGSVPLSINTANVTTSKYTGVIAGITLAEMSAKTYLNCGSLACNVEDPTRTYDGHAWYLTQQGSTNVWDLFFSGFGPSAANTQSALNTHAQHLMSSFNLQRASLNTALSYDCTTFDANGFCVAAGGRYTSLSNDSSFQSSHAMFVTSIKLAEYVRIGGYLDQNTSSRLSDVSLDNKGPLAGIFMVFSQHDKREQGLALRLGVNYQSKKADILRDIVGNSEEGTGRATLDAMGAIGQLTYSFYASDKMLLTQYLGLRYTAFNRGSYFENSDINSPLTYKQLKDELGSVMAGLKMSIALANDFSIQGHLGFEDDFHHKTDQLIATGVDGLTPITLTQDKTKIRGVAGLGASLNITKYQVLKGYVDYQQLPYQTRSALTGMLTYEIGL